jgi:type II secretory pathway component HofQ
MLLLPELSEPELIERLRSRVKNCFCSLGMLCWLLASGLAYSNGQPPPGYGALVQQGKTQLQAGSADQALRSGLAAIKMSAGQWEGYALAGGALMNLKRYEEAADTLGKAIERAPESKQPALRDLRRQCLLAESGSPAATTPAPATSTSQAEIVLWKSIENSRNSADFQTYLDQYPQGAFVALAQRHLAEALAQSEQDKQSSMANGAVGARPADALTGGEILTIDFRRGDDGTARVIVQLTSLRTRINLRRDGNQIIAEFAGTVTPKKLLRRYDVSDFATPVKTIDALRVGSGSQLVVTAKGDFEHAAHRVDDRYTIEIKPL